MPIIKRYANRKLYDTEATQYITLDGIAELIRQGAEVTVVDHASGDDITAQVQAQIIFAEEKKGGSLLPQRLFTDLIQTSSQKLARLRQALTPGHLEAVNAEIERRLAVLVAQGALSDAEGLRLLDLLLKVDQPVATFSDADLERVIRERDLPTRKDVTRLSRQLDALQTELNQLLRSRPKPRE